MNITDSFKWQLNVGAQLIVFASIMFAACSIFLHFGLMLLGGGILFACLMLQFKYLVECDLADVSIYVALFVAIYCLVFFCINYFYWLSDLSQTDEIMTAVYLGLGTYAANFLFFKVVRK